MTTKTITSRDGQWTYTLCGDTRVVAVTHNPTGRTIPVRASLTFVRKQAADGTLTAMVFDAIASAATGDTQ